MVSGGVTSWTKDRAVAKTFAGKNGIILEIRDSATVRDLVVPRPDIGKYGHESEVLLRGIINAIPTRP